MNVNFNPNKIIGKLGEVSQDFKGSYVPRFEKIEDSFTSTISKYEKELKKAFEFCRQTVCGSSPKESYYAFGSKGNKLISGIGEEFKCNMDFSKLEPESTVIHSHPESCYFSVQDLLTLAKVDDIRTIGSIDSKGRTCLAIKPENFGGISDRPMAFSNAANEIFQSNWLEKFNVSTNKKDWLEFHEKQLMEKLNIHSREELYSSLWLDISDDPDKCMKSLGEYIFMSNGIQKFTPMQVAYKKISSQIDVASEEGMRVMKKINEEICNLFGFTYKCSD